LACQRGFRLKRLDVYPDGAYVHAFLVQDKA